MPVVMCDEFLVLEELRGLRDYALRRATTGETRRTTHTGGRACCSSWGRITRCSGSGSLVVREERERS